MQLGSPWEKNWIEGVESSNYVADIVDFLVMFQAISGQAHGTTGAEVGELAVIGLPSGFWVYDTINLSFDLNPFSFIRS